jgi:hypothetical protein
MNGPRRESTGCAEQPAVLDAAVLAGQTLGDEALARSVLAMFLDQSADVLRVVRDTQDPQARADAAHLLKGSSRAGRCPAKPRPVGGCSPSRQCRGSAGGHRGADRRERFARAVMLRGLAKRRALP